MPKDCKACGTENKIQAETCEQCGEKFTGKAGGNSGGGCLVFIVLAVLIGGAIFIFGSGGDDEPSADDQKFAAFDTCKEFVTERLKAPGTATFRNFYEEDGEVIVTGSGDGPYTVVSTVDAQNSFGADLRTRFTCTVINTTGDTWRLQDLELEE
jgi:hypothetical protein